MRPSGLSIGVRAIRPGFGRRLVNSPCSHSAAPGPVTRYLAKLEHSVRPTRSRTARHSSATTGNALERRNVTSSTGSSPGRWNHSGCSSPKPAPHTALCSVSRSYTGVVCSGRAGGQLLVRERDPEPPAVVLPHLGVGVGERRPVAEPGDVHAPHVELGITGRHPVGQRQPDAAALRQPGHHRARDPVVADAADGPTSGLPSGANVNGPLITRLIPAVAIAG